MSVLAGLLGETRPAAANEDGLTGRERWWGELFGARASSGVSVNEDTAMKFSAVWKAVNLRSKVVGFLPLHLYRRLDRGKERADRHPVARLVRDRPNPYMSAHVFRRTLEGHALRFGNGYAEIERSAGGRPLALWPLPPNRVKVKIEGRSGAPVYEFRPQAGEPVPLLYRDVLHIQGPGGSGYGGFNVVHYMRDAVGLGLGAQKFAAKFYANGAHISGLLMHPGKLTDEAEKNLRASWTNEYGGLDNVARIAILEEAMKFEKIGVTQKDAEFIATARLSIADISRFLDVPLHMLSELSRATFSNIAHQGQEFLTYSLMDSLTAWADEVAYKLLLPSEHGAYFCEFVTLALLRGDPAARATFYHNALTDGWMNRNEVRTRENMNAVDGLDNFLEPLNMAGAGTRAVGAQAESLRPIVEDALRRAAAREEKAVARAAKRTSGDPEAMRAWLDDFLAEHREFLSRALLPVVAALAPSVPAPAAAVTGFAGAYGERLERSLLDSLSNGGPLAWCMARARAAPEEAGAFLRQIGETHV